MRNCLLRLAMVLFLGLPFSGIPVPAQTGPAEATTPLDITALVIDPIVPATIYAGTRDGGVFKTTDAGQKWVAINSGLQGTAESNASTNHPFWRQPPTGEHIRALAINPVDSRTLYAGTRDQGVFKSTDGGLNWQAVNTGLTSLLIQALAIDPTNPANVYAGTRDRGVFRSFDGGQNWEAVNTGLTSLFVQALVIDPTNPATVYAGTRAGEVFRGAAARSADGVFKSTDWGWSWTGTNLGLARPYIEALAIDPINPSIIFAATERDGVIRSDNGGESWTAISTGFLGCRALAIDPRNSATIFAGTWGSGIFKSTDGGQTWINASAGLTVLWIYGNTLRIDPTTPDTVYAGNDDGVFKSTNGGASWRLTGTE